MTAFELLEVPVSLTFFFIGGYMLSTRDALVGRYKRGIYDHPNYAKRLRRQAELSGFEEHRYFRLNSFSFLLFFTSIACFFGAFVSLYGLPAFAALAIPPIAMSIQSYRKHEKALAENQKELH